MLKIAILTALLVACGTPYKTQTIPTADTDKAYRAAVQALVGAGYSVETSDAEAGVVTSAWQDQAIGEAEERIRITVNQESRISLDCRTKDPLSGQAQPCADGSRFSDSMVAAAKQIGAEIRQ